MNNNKVLVKFDSEHEEIDLMLRNLLPSDIDLQCVDTDYRKDIATEYLVKHTPCLILYENGIEIDRIEGEITREKLKQFLNQ